MPSNSVGSTEGIGNLIGPALITGESSHLWPSFKSRGEVPIFSLIPIVEGRLPPSAQLQFPEKGPCIWLFNSRREIPALGSNSRGDVLAFDSTPTPKERFVPSAQLQLPKSGSHLDAQGLDRRTHDSYPILFSSCNIGGDVCNEACNLDSS